jgi:Ca2+-binding EF-hand superfamily protein
MSFNTVYRKAPGTRGSWKTGTDEKQDRLKSVFKEVASLNGNSSNTITPHALLLALRDRTSLLNEYFGKKSSDELLHAFGRLDVTGAGEITMEQFLKGATLALSESQVARALKRRDSTEGKKPASNVGGKSVPLPPPMSREMLYRSVFNSVDKIKKGWVSLKDLTKAMKDKRSELVKVFGPQRSSRALQSFCTLDADRTGKVTFEQFFVGAELAFTNHVKTYRAKDPKDRTDAPPVMMSGKAPRPPPMTRDLLYRSVYKSIDVANKGFISQKDLVKAMGKRRSSISMIFGHKNTDHAMKVFQKLDADDDGRVKYEKFFSNCESAFLVDEEQDEGPTDLAPAPPLHSGMEIPFPPPMTRELLYRSVYDEIDTMKNGTITQIDLVKAFKKGRRSSVAKIFGENALNDAVTAFQDMDVDGDGEVSWKNFFLKAEEAFVENPNKRINAPRRKSLLRRASMTTAKPPPAPPLPPQAPSSLPQKQKEGRGIPPI